MQEKVVLGETAIIVRDANFKSGLEAGNRLFTTTRKGRILSDVQIYVFISRTWADMSQDSAYKGGFIVGWIQAMLGVPLDGNEEGKHEQ